MDNRLALVEGGVTPTGRKLARAGGLGRTGVTVTECGTDFADGGAKGDGWLSQGAKDVSTF